MDIAEYKRKAILAWHLFLSSSYRNTRKTRLYDPEYMGKISSFLPLDAKEPLWGYLKKSGNQLLKEGELLKKGWMQFPDPHPLFDTAYYLCRYFPQGLDENPYVHYLQKGWRKGLLPGPFLAENFALSRQQCPLLPIQENIEKTTNDWFSPSCYLAKNQTVEQIGDTLLVRHYKLYGSQEAKSPCLLFSPSHYLEQLEKEQRQRALADPLSHYICSLFLEKRDNATQPSPFFDPLFYCKRYNIPPTEKNICRYLSGREKSVRYSSKRSCEFKILPTFSILVPVYNPHLRQLDTCIRSVIYQTYPHWQLCLVDDGSTSMDVQNRLQFWAEQEPRINITFHHKNKGIAEATNTAAAMATGQFLGFLDNDDELSFHCLEEIAAALNRCPADMLYTDEALISADGIALSFFRKPVYNPRLLLSHNYITHFMVVKKDLFTQAGGCDPSYNGAQDYDIALKICERTSNITHIAKPLYHWRASENSTSINHDTKNYANENGKKALAAALKRQQINRCAENSELNFYYRITSATPPAAAQIFIWQPQDTQKSTSSKQEIISENDNITDIIYVTAPEKQKAAALTKAVIQSKTSAPFLLFLDAPFLSLADNWPIFLQTAFFDENVGMVTGRRKFAGADGPSYRLPDITRQSTAFFAEFLASHTLHANGMHCLQDILCPGFGMLAIRSELFNRHKGFAEKYSLLAPADLALKIRQDGYSTVYTPEAWINFPKEKSKLVEDCGKEKKHFQQQWQKELQHDKHYYNQGLLEDAGIRKKAFSLWFYGNK